MNKDSRQNRIKEISKEINALTTQELERLLIQEESELEVSSGYLVQSPGASSLPPSMKDARVLTMPQRLHGYSLGTE